MVGITWFTYPLTANGTIMSSKNAQNSAIATAFQPSRHVPLNATRLLYISTRTPGSRVASYTEYQYRAFSTSLNASTYLAPKHHPNSLPLIFFAIFTSRFKPMSYPVCKRPTMKFRSKQYSGRPFSSSNAPSTAPKLAHPF